MTKEAKARIIIEQDGSCAGFLCGRGSIDECPAHGVCSKTDDTKENRKNAVSVCREFLGETVIDDAVIGTPRTNAPAKTLLDEFAMAAMEAIVGKRPYMTVSNGDSDALETALMIVRSDVNGAYTVAAAMMKERARRDEMGNVKGVK